MDFAKRLRTKLDTDTAGKLKVALDGVSTWLLEEVLPTLESHMEEAAERGEDEVHFEHVYGNSFRPETDDIEDLSAWKLLKAKADELGLECLPLSFKRLSFHDPAKYPYLEVRVKVPLEKEQRRGFFT